MTFDNSYFIKRFFIWSRSENDYQGGIWYFLIVNLLSPSIIEPWILMSSPVFQTLSKFSWPSARDLMSLDFFLNVTFDMTACLLYCCVCQIVWLTFFFYFPSCKLSPRSVWFLFGPKIWLIFFLFQCDYVAMSICSKGWEIYYFDWMHAEGSALLAFYTNMKLYFISIEQPPTSIQQGMNNKKNLFYNNFENNGAQKIWLCLITINNQEASTTTIRKRKNNNFFTTMCWPCPFMFGQ